MAATQTVPQLLETRNSLTFRHGVLTLFGYGINVSVERGHLIVKDGIGAYRVQARLPRVGHGLRRLVIIGSDGFISLAAVRWLADQDAAFVMLERDGFVLATTGPVRPSDARLRRAQSLAHQSGAALQIARELIDQKIVGQERVARDILRNSSVADLIASGRAALATAGTIEAVRHFEAQAAQAYWSAWSDIAINFPRNDLNRVPDHWRYFGTRKSPLTGSPRLAVNPPNAILNYLYAVLESEARLAASTLGLDPGIGVLHVDTDARDSLACDLMEPIRPEVDAYLLNWIIRGPLRREWFFEERDGNCRLMGSFTVRLSETAPTWGRAVAPIAERVSRTLWAKRSRPYLQSMPATRLTESHLRRARGEPVSPTVTNAPIPPKVCKICGTSIKRSDNYCASCAVSVTRESLLKAAQKGRIASHSQEAEIRRSETQRRHHSAAQDWRPSELPDWLNDKTYREKIQPRLAEITVPTIATALRISEPYATDIRAGRRVPHPRHWEVLAKLTGYQPFGQAEENALLGESSRRFSRNGAYLSQHRSAR
jgi:CRISPR-associated endonuclease Cas1